MDRDVSPGPQAVRPSRSPSRPPASRRLAEAPLGRCCSWRGPTAVPRPWTSPRARSCGSGGGTPGRRRWETGWRVIRHRCPFWLVCLRKGGVPLVYGDYSTFTSKTHLFLQKATYGCRGGGLGGELGLRFVGRKVGKTESGLLGANESVLNSLLLYALDSILGFQEPYCRSAKIKAFDFQLLAIHVSTLSGNHVLSPLTGAVLMIGLLVLVTPPTACQSLPFVAHRLRPMYAEKGFHFHCFP